jgi:hypothetical protein
VGYDLRCGNLSWSIRLLKQIWGCHLPFISTNTAAPGGRRIYPQTDNRQKPVRYNVIWLELINSTNNEDET